MTRDTVRTAFAVAGALLGTIAWIALVGPRGLQAGALAGGLLGMGLSSAAVAFIGNREDDRGMKLHRAETVPLSLSHPFLQIRAAITEGGRVTILVDGVAKDVALTSRMRDTRIEGLEQKTGDPAFDARVRVTGNSLSCRSILDQATRDAVRAAFEQFPDVVVEAGQLRWKGTRHFDVEGTASKLLELAARLLPPDLLAGLEKSARNDPSPAVRLRALDLLVTRFSQTPETRRIALAALADRDPAVRLKAALFIGPEGHDVLAALAENESLAAELRAEAVRGAVQLPRERAAAIVRGALTDHREAVRTSAIVIVGRLKLASCNDRLAVLLRRANPRVVRNPVSATRNVLSVNQQLAIVEAAAATEDESAEAPLLEALDGGEREVKLAAIRALATLGTIKSIEPLLALRGNQLLVGELGPPAGAAVAAIQARLAGAGAGQLAIVDTSGGEVSFPGAERGSLTVPDGEAGGLTLTQEEVDGRRRAAAIPRKT